MSEQSVIKSVERALDGVLCPRCIRPLFYAGSDLAETLCDEHLIRYISYCVQYSAIPNDTYYLALKQEAMKRGL